MRERELNQPRCGDCGLLATGKDGKPTAVCNCDAPQLELIRGTHKVKQDKQCMRCDGLFSSCRKHTLQQTHDEEEAHRREEEHHGLFSLLRRFLRPEEPWS